MGTQRSPLQIDHLPGHFNPLDSIRQLISMEFDCFVKAFMYAIYCYASVLPNVAINVTQNTAASHCINFMSSQPEAVPLFIERP